MALAAGVVALVVVVVVVEGDEVDGVDEHGGGWLSGAPTLCTTLTAHR